MNSVSVEIDNNMGTQAFMKKSLDEVHPTDAFNIGFWQW